MMKLFPQILENVGNSRNKFFACLETFLLVVPFYRGRKMIDSHSVLCLESTQHVRIHPPPPSIPIYNEVMNSYPDYGLVLLVTELLTSPASKIEKKRNVSISFHWKHEVCEWWVHFPRILSSFWHSSKEIAYIDCLFFKYQILHDYLATFSWTLRSS